MTELKPMPEQTIIAVPAQAWNDIVAKIARLEKYIVLSQREVLIKSLCALEDDFGLPRTKEKRVR